MMNLKKRLNIILLLSKLMATYTRWYEIIVSDIIPPLFSGVILDLRDLMVPMIMILSKALPE
jgi:hypothetical protein